MRTFFLGVAASFLASLLLFSLQTFVWTSEDAVLASLPKILVLATGSLLAVLALLTGLPAAYLRLLTMGRLRGLWHANSLNRMLVRDYKTSADGLIKVKATRCYNLFVRKNAHFQRCITDAGLRMHHVTLRVLMHYPCLDSNHLRRRARVYGLTTEEFVLSWWDTVVELHRAGGSGDNRIAVDVRFYGERFTPWRFYVFKNAGVLFLNYYDSATWGSKTPMYRIRRGPRTLYSVFDNRFDEIWNHQSVEALAFLSNRLKQREYPTSCCRRGGRCWNLREKHLGRLQPFLEATA